MRYRLTPRAEREAERAHARWKKTRASAPTLFLDELAAAFEQVVAQPLSGSEYGSHAGVLVRRVLCVRSRFHVYYAVDEHGPLFLSVWGSQRRQGPRFRRVQ